MSEKNVPRILEQSGLDVDAATAMWRDSLGLLAALDAIGRDGANALVKVDGGRSDGQVYSVVVSGGRLGDDFVRKDGADLQLLLSEALSFYAARARVGP